MTARAFSVPQKEKLTPGQLCFGLFGFFCLLLILRNSDLAIEYMSRGLRLCARTVIPSLFPFMVLSELILSAGLASALPRFLTSPMRRLFGLSPDGCCAVLFGMLCGVPVGARCAILSLEQGRITREEAEHILTFSNNPSSAFLISAVGVSLWENRAFGVALYATVLAAALFTGFFGNLLRRHKKSGNLPAVPPDTVSARPAVRLPSGAKLFTSAIRSAAGSMLLVCAYVVFFSALVGTLNLLSTALSLPPFFQSLLFCLFEFSGGVSNAAALSDTFAAALLCAFAAGWSGLSVHCQVLSLCDGRGIRFRSYFLAKLLQGLLCVLIFALLLHCFPALTVPARRVQG